MHCGDFVTYLELRRVVVDVEDVDVERSFVVELVRSRADLNLVSLFGRFVIQFDFGF